MDVFSVAYLPSISYLSAFLKSENAVVDTGEFFIKQTIRTRTDILTANGRLQLSIPVEKGSKAKTPLHEVRISYAEPWQRKHEQAIVSAYKNAPYFEHYADVFLTLLSAKHELLVNYHLDFLQWFMQVFQFENKTISISKTYISDGVQNDFRNGDFHLINKTYKQVFSYKFPFQANLSSIDLLFNKGPEAPIFL